MAMMERWGWTAGLAAAVLGVGALLALALEGAGSGSAINLGGAALLAAVAYVVLCRDAMMAWLKLASTARALGSWLATALALALSVGLVALASRYDATLDLTRTQRNTLSDQAIAVLEDLSRPVTATAFATPLSPGREEVARLLSLAAEHTDRLEIELVDPIAAPRRAREAGITGEHSIVLLQVAGRPPVRLDGSIDEQDLVSGLVEATSEGLHRVCWTVDHGEADPDDETSLTGLGGVRTALERLNYQVTLTRLVVDGIDPDCELVVIARPVLELSDAVITALDQHVLAGGQLFVLIEPQQAEALTRWLTRYGIEAYPLAITQPRARQQIAGADPSALWLASGFPHPITSDLAGLAFVGARPVDPDYTIDGVEVEGIVWTGDDAYVDDTPRPLPGPFAIATVARVDEPRRLGPLTPDGPPPTLRAGGRIVVVGDADFASRRGAQLANNTDLFLNAVAWLVREPAQLGARPAPAETLRMSQGALTLHGVLFVLVWPGLGAVGAVAMFLRRRNAGRPRGVSD